MISQLPDSDGKIWVPAPDKHITLQGPVSAAAFFWTLERAKSVRVVPYE